jgi:cell division protein ZapB
MSRIDELTDRIERLLLRHEELRRTNALLQQQLTVTTQERDSLRARLSAARSRIDALIDKLPQVAGAQVEPARRPEDLIAMKQIEVSIMGQSYLLGCPDGGEPRLREAVAPGGPRNVRHPRQRQAQGTRTHRRAGSVEPGLRLERSCSQTAPVAAAPQTPTGHVDTTLPAPEYLNQLIATPGQALDSDGHLI